jgi:hypothetical protein
MLDGTRQSLPQARVGATAARGSGMNTLVFFGLIVFFVAAAGIVGVVLWGPDKTVASRQHLASEPAASASSQSSPEASASAASSADAPPPAATEAPAPADSATAKKGKKAKPKKGH